MRSEIDAMLMGPGGPFEVTRERVLGEDMEVFKERPRSLRELVIASRVLGDAEYIVCEDRRISFAEHARVVASVARALQERYGVQKGDRVAVLAANCPEWIVTFWAATSLGAICVGLNGWWVRDEILYGIEDSEPALLVGDRRRLARIDGSSLKVPVVEIESGFQELWNHDRDASLSEEPIDEDDPATILYTSGTTGRPKGAVNTHRNIIALTRLQILHGVRSVLVRSNPQPEPSAAVSNSQPEPSAAVANCALVTTPLFHVSGLYSGAITSLVAGMKTVWTTGRFDPVVVMQLLDRERVRTWGPTGTMLHRVVHHPDVGRYDFGHVTHVGSGGAPVGPSLQERVREVFPAARGQLGVGYGLTEGTALATLNSGEELERHPDSVGRPLPTIAVEIRDSDGKPVSEGVEGDVHIRGPLVMKEYWRRPRETAETVLPGRWLRTGDVGRIEEGRLFISSRKRDLILRGGENVYPAEIEICLETHPDVLEAAVLGVEHADLGQEVKAIVVPQSGAQPDPAELAKWVGERLAYFKVPAHWELHTEALPRNASGKVMKHVLTGEVENAFQEE